jgi:hypothetical protein
MHQELEDAVKAQEEKIRVSQTYTEFLEDNLKASSNYQ